MLGCDYGKKQIIASWGGEQLKERRYSLNKNFPELFLSQQKKCK
jgi:hypothetical protein